MRTVVIFFLTMISVFETALANDKLYNNFCYLKFVNIEGFTNINSFSFTYVNQKSSSVAAHESIVAKDSPVNFMIPVEEFKGSNPGIKKKFNNLLKSSAYPEIIVDIERSAFEKIMTNSSSADFNVSITLAGIKRTIKAEYSTHSYLDSGILLSGTTKLNLADFYLNPPKKAWGLIKVKDFVLVKFNMVMGKIQ